MAVSRRRDLVASRRRKADEGEEDEAESIDYESQSEGSLLSGANDSLEDEVSEGSRTRQISGGAGTKSGNRKSDKKLIRNGLKPASANALSSNAAPNDATLFTRTADSEAMLNGVNPSSEIKGDQPIQFDDGSKSGVPQVNGDISEKAIPFSKRENQRAAINRTKDHKSGARQNGSMSTDNTRYPRRKGRESSSFGLAFKYVRGFGVPFGGVRD